MLSSRLFRNAGLAPVLRSLTTPRTSLPASVSVQLRSRLGVGAYRRNSQLPAGGSAPSSAQNASKAPEALSLSSPPPSSSSTESSDASKTVQRLKTDPLEPRLSITFTCTAPECTTRSSHTFTKQAYEKGVVLVQCPGCKNRHLIADNLHWFEDSTEHGRLRNIEDIMKARGETVRRGIKIGEGEGGVLEMIDGKITINVE
ncbi:zf-DNL-domain-containing protein [Athelia psychrophila]|uniref:Zf-DNL-domain-containing protein n=1 Tax=Athelia psychrophila TaxID=1759441 RepID=A0A165X7W6_9AGAM|nr:zf-DNL-domain-containing protein [Fibularhizoctonia sp. CBS 109695]